MSRIIRDVRERGEVAVRSHSARLDRWDPPSFRLDEDAIDAAEVKVPDALKKDIFYAIDQVRNFARLEKQRISDLEVETRPVSAWGRRKSR